MSGQKRPSDPCGPSSSGAPPEKRREREGEDGTPGVSTGGSTAVETVIKLGGVSNSVSPLLLISTTANICVHIFSGSLFVYLLVFSH